MIAIYSQPVHALALNAGSMDNDAGRYCNFKITINVVLFVHRHILFNVIPESQNICYFSKKICTFWKITIFMEKILLIFFLVISTFFMAALDAQQNFIFLFLLPLLDQKL